MESLTQKELNALKFKSVTIKEVMELLREDYFVTINFYANRISLRNNEIGHDSNFRYIVKN